MEGIEAGANPGPVDAIARKQRIVELVNQRGYMRSSVLSDLFGVTNETIRRDLMQLADVGLVNRSHGGAVARARNETSFDRRLNENEAAKKAIGCAAAALVKDDSTIILDSGSTTIHLARELGDKRDLVIVTNAVTHAVELMEHDNLSVILTGGLVRRPTYGASGELAVTMLSELSVDQTFLAINSISLENGLMYPHMEEIAVKRAMMASAAEVILLADSSKFNARSLFKVAPLEAVSLVITDSGIDDAMAAAIRERGIDLIVAPADSEPSGM